MYGDRHAENKDANDMTKNELKWTKDKHDHEKMQQAIYNHMRNRMKKDLISYQLTINDLSESLRSKKRIHEAEKKQALLARQNKQQSKFNLDNLMKHI